VGENAVGGSYLTHMINTLNSFTGRDSWKKSANRNKPLPLLVVHSGKTTIGLLDVLRISSSERGVASIEVI